MERKDLPPDDFAESLALGGEMGRRIRDADWGASSMGPPGAWPATLRSALTLFLPSAAQVAIFWGEDYVAFYNDAHAEAMSDMHPGGFARPAREWIGETWEALGPMLEKVRTTGRTVAARDHPFHVLRDGHRQLVYFDISYSPMLLPDGSVGGVLSIVSDTTERVHKVEAIGGERERLRRMFDQAPGFIAVLRGPDHVIEMANETYREMTGHRPLVGLPYAQALPDVAAIGFVEKLDEVRRTGLPFRGRDMPVKLPTAEPGGLRDYWIDFICQPIADADGQVTAIFIEGVDRTDRHQARQALQRGRASLEQATEAGEIATWEYDLRRDRFYCSPRGLYFYGLPPDTPFMTLARFRECVNPEDRAALREIFPSVIDPTVRAPLDIEYRVVRPAGEDTRWLSARGRGLFEGDVCVRVVGTLADVTTRKSQAEAWRESEERFRALADSLPALVWMTEPDGRVSFASKGFETILGIAPHEVAAGGWVALLRPDRRDEALRNRAGWLARPASMSGEYPVLTACGEERWVHIEARPRFLGSEFQGYTACGIDVTEAHVAGERLEARIALRTAELTEQIAERERVEETLHQMQRLEAIGQLTSGVAHDFNNLLTVILGNVDALTVAGQRGLLDQRLRTRFDHIRVAAERGAALTAQLLAFSRRQRLEAKVVDLRLTVLGLLDLLGSTLGREIAIETRAAMPVWPALVDPTQMELIILNLAINARDAMVGGGLLTLSVDNVRRGAPSRAEEPPPGDYVRVTVQDTGTGMPPAVLAHAFEPFFTTKEVGKGSGLGLAQVFGFAKQSGGGVRIDSAPGEGTTVSVFLPRAATQAIAEPAPAAPPLPQSLAGTTVMVLDDDDRVRQIAVDTLREAGCRVVEAADGAAALDAFFHEPGIQLVVTDIAMPGMNGIEFAQHVARRHAHVGILFVTGHADPSEIAGVAEDRLIRKPYPRALLLERVRALLHAR
jgi:PAS domain S-box-containing protein